MTEGIEQFRQYLVNPESAEQLPVSMIGLVLYGDAQKLAVIGSNQGGDLVYGCLETQTVKTALADVQSTRVLHLEEIDEVNIVQVDLGSLEIGTLPSVRQKQPAVAVRLSYKDPNTGEEKKHILEERQLLDLMVGHQGGLAVFHGGDRPEENALVIEDLGGSKKSAMIAFLHPQDAIWGLDSVNGVAEFFHRLSNEFLAKTELPKDVRDAVEQLEAKKQEIPENGARVEILKASLIAHARLAQQTGDPTHQQFLDKHLANLKPGCLSLLFPNDRQSMDDVSKSIDEAVRGLIVTEKKSRTKDKPKEVEFQLKTQRVKEMYDFFRAELGEKFGAFDQDVLESMNRYLLKIAEYILDTHSLDELDDCDVLLQELDNTPYSTSGYYYPFDWESLGLFQEAEKSHFNGLIDKHEPQIVAREVTAIFSFNPRFKPHFVVHSAIFGLRDCARKQIIFETNKMFEEKMRGLDL